MDDNEEITLQIHRNTLNGLPERLEALAAVPEQAAERAKLLVASKAVRGWLSSKAITIPCLRARRSWKWLMGAAKAAGAHQAARVIARHLNDYDIQVEVDAERREDAKRLAAAMAEFREGGGECS